MLALFLTIPLIAFGQANVHPASDPKEDTQSLVDQLIHRQHMKLLFDELDDQKKPPRSRQWRQRLPQEFRQRQSMPNVPESSKGAVIARLREIAASVETDPVRHPTSKDDARLALIQLGDEQAMQELADQILDLKTDITFHQRAIQIVLQPRLIPHLVRIAAQKRFTVERRSQNVFIPVSDMAALAILRQVAHGEVFNRHTRASARTMAESGVSESVVAAILKWYDSNRDQFAEEDYTKVSEIWMPDLNDNATRTPNTPQP